MDTNITSEIIKARKAVKHKLDALKRNELLIEKSFAPITAPLKTIVKHIEHEDPLSKGNIKIEPKSEPIKKYKKLEEEEYLAPDDDNNSNLSKTSSQSEYLNQFSDLPRTYISGLIRDSTGKYDVKYGVRYNLKDDNYYIGNSKIQFEDDNSLIINDNEYQGTEGLYELLFKKFPRHYTDDDKKQYISIIKSTSAHKRLYQPTEQISWNRSWKYKHIIKPMTHGPRVRHVVGSTNKLGKGLLMDVTNNPIDYVYWDDPNELVDRLRLLLASQEAGNSNHNNEINSIIEELIEAKIIEP